MQFLEGDGLTMDKIKLGLPIRYANELTHALNLLQGHMQQYLSQFWDDCEQLVASLGTTVQLHAMDATQLASLGPSLFLAAVWHVVKEQQWSNWAELK